MAQMSRTEIQQRFIRVCRDSGFQLEATRAAQIAAGASHIHPLDVWVAFGDMSTMDRIADGSHPAAKGAA